MFSFFAKSAVRMAAATGVTYGLVKAAMHNEQSLQDEEHAHRKLGVPTKREWVMLSSYGAYQRVVPDTPKPNVEETEKTPSAVHP